MGMGYHQMDPKTGQVTAGQIVKDKEKEAADRVLAHIYGHVDAFTARPPRPRELFAAAGLMRCCALLKGVIVLDEAGMPALTGILLRQLWEVWLVSFYALLAGDEALHIIASDDIYWKRRLSGALRLEQDDYHPEWSGTAAKINYTDMSRRVISLLRAREAVDGPGDVTCLDVIYRFQSLASVHANLTTIGSHLVERDGEGAVSENSSLTLNNVVVTPVLLTVHLAQYVFKEFGLDADAMDPFVASLRSSPRSIPPPTRRKPSSRSQEHPCVVECIRTPK